MVPLLPVLLPLLAICMPSLLCYGCNAPALVAHLLQSLGLLALHQHASAGRPADLQTQRTSQWVSEAAEQLPGGYLSAAGCMSIALHAIRRASRQTPLQSVPSISGRALNMWMGAVVPAHQMPVWSIATLGGPWKCVQAMEGQGLLQASDWYCANGECWVLCHAPLLGPCRHWAFACSRRCCHHGARLLPRLLPSPSLCPGQNKNA